MYILVACLLIVFMLWLPFVVICEKFDKDKKPLGERLGLYSVIYFICVALVYGFLSFKM
jgi:hypothetical protein